MTLNTSKIFQIITQKIPEKKYKYSYSIKPTNFLILSPEKQQRKLNDFFNLLESTDKEILITLTRNPITVHYKNEDTEMEVLEVLVDSMESLDNSLQQIGFSFSRDGDETHLQLKSVSEGISDFTTYVDDNKILGKAYTLERMPSMLPDAWIHRLFEAFHQIQITINPISAEKAMKIAKNKKAVYTQLKSQNSKDEKRMEDILKLVDQVELGLTQLFSFSINGFVFAENHKQLRVLDKKARKKLSSLNTIMTDSYGQQANIVNGGGISWFGTTESTAIFYPFTSSAMLETNGFVLGVDRYKSPVIYDPKYRKNHNIFTCGTMGSGKSFGNKIMIKRFRTKHPKSMCIIIDPQEEYLPHADYFGLEQVKIIPGEQYGLNPFDLFKNESEVIDILASFTDAPDVIVNEWRSKCDGLKSIKELYNIISDEGKKYLVDLVEGPVSKIFEGENKFSDQMIISLKDTENTKTEKLIILLVLTWAWKRINKLPETQWKYLLLEEAWRMTKLKLSGQKIAEIAREIRKRSGIFAVCTQLFSDLDSVMDSQSKVTDLFETKIVMNLAPTAAKEVGKALDLQPIEIERIENFKKGETVLFTSDNTIYFKFEADEKETTVYFNTDAEKE